MAGVCLGDGYVHEQITNVLANHGIQAVVSRFINNQQIQRPTRYPNSNLRNKASSFISKKIEAEIENLSGELSSNSFYQFLIENDQKRHLDNHFETIHSHAVELLLPFFESEFLIYVFTISQQ